MAPLSCQSYFFVRDSPLSEVKILLHGNLRHGSFLSSVAAGHTNQKRGPLIFSFLIFQSPHIILFYNLYFICIFLPRGAERDPAIAMKTHRRLLLCVLLHWRLGEIYPSSTSPAFLRLPLIIKVYRRRRANVHNHQDSFHRPAAFSLMTRLWLSLQNIICSCQTFYLPLLQLVGRMNVNGKSRRSPKQETSQLCGRQRLHILISLFLFHSFSQHAITGYL